MLVPEAALLAELVDVELTMRCELFSDRECERATDLPPGVGMLEPATALELQGEVERDELVVSRLLLRPAAGPEKQREGNANQNKVK